MRAAPISPNVDPSDSQTASEEPLIAQVESRPTGGAKRSLLSSLVYSLGFTIQRAIGLLLLPVYTSLLSPAEYGVIGVLMSVYVAAGLIFGFALETIITRNYFQLANQPTAREQFLDSAWRFLIVFPTCVAAALTALFWIVAGHVGVVGPIELGLTLFAAAINAASTTLPLSVLRARQDLRGYLTMSAVLAVGATSLTLLFVVGLGEGIRGWFAATLLGNLLLLVTAFRVVPWNRRGGFRWSPVRIALLFSLPLIPHVVSHWALQLADRGVLAGIISSHQLGLYTLAANLASVLMMLVMAVNQGFIPTYARAGAEDGLERELADTVVLQIWIVGTLTLGVALMGPRVLTAITPPSYEGAAQLVPWLALGYGFLGLYFIPMNGATLGAGRRRFAWVATAFSAALNVVLLVVLVPRFGLTAAAEASTISYLSLLCLNSAWAHSGENPVTYRYPVILVLLGSAVITYVVASLTRPGGALADLAWGSVVFAVYVVGSGLVLARELRRERLSDLAVS